MTDVDWRRIQITQDVASNFVSERSNSSATKNQIDRHALSRRDRLEVPVRVQERLKDVFCDMPYNRDTDTVTTNVIGFVVALRQHVIVIQSH